MIATLLVLVLGFAVTEASIILYRCWRKWVIEPPRWWRRWRRHGVHRRWTTDKGTPLYGCPVRWWGWVVWWFYPVRCVFWTDQANKRAAFRAHHLDQG